VKGYKPVVAPLSLVIAGLGITIEGVEAHMLQALSERYGGYLWEELFPHRLRVVQSSTDCVDQPESMRFDDWKFSISSQRLQGHIDLQQNRSELVLFRKSGVIEFDYFTRIVFSCLAVQAGGALIHAAAAVRHGGALVFFGPSGSGKSTVASLAGDYLVLNDDLVALLPSDKCWTVFSTPYWNQYRGKNDRPRWAPLVGLFRLVQDRRVFLEVVSSGEALAELLACVPVIGQSALLSAQLLTICANVLDQIPFYRLHFLPDDSFWNIIPEHQASQYQPDVRASTS